MDNCIFCQIIAGKISCYKVYEDKNYLGFLDIYPRVRGHTLVIPKKHFQWVYDVPEFDKYWLTVLKITNALKKALNPHFITYITHGLDIPHAHVHILPRKDESEIVPPIKKIFSEELKRIAEDIYKLLKA